ncbi:MAG: hypothetical protein HLUCCA08_10900 [Rhodobacteraceae bacterium HLUCCA08]|nr:MAG: hypothetical protein HLUCCA08_10900 [Rhodobacteraceae bacterium HLUCCA08]
MQNAKPIPLLSTEMTIAAQVSAAQDNIAVEELIELALERELRRRAKRRAALRRNRLAAMRPLQPDLA